LLGNRDAITRVDCAEFGEAHEMLKLLGAPPSYVGSDIEPLLSQKNIDKHQTKKSKINIILFDEIEKAHPRLHDGILTILGDGRLTLNNNQIVDFTNSFIFLTTNLGSKEMAQAVEGSGIGFTRSTAQKIEMDDRLYRTAKDAAKKKFRPEFMNRLDSTIVFRALTRDSILQIMKIELEELQWRIWSAPYRNFKLEAGAKMPEAQSIVFKLTESAKDFLLNEGTSELYGARELNRAIDRFIGFPMASLIASKQVKHGDRIKVDWAIAADTDLTFTNKGKL
jgi:ATP-dependent Clp protease ATP-binding subunit ClpB